MARRTPNSKYFQLIAVAAIAILSVLHAQEEAPLGEVVGGRNLIIPPPHGYVRSDGINDQWDQITDAFTPPGNRMIATYTSESDQQILARNGQPEIQRHLYLQVIRALESADFDAAQFTKRKEDIRKEILEHQESTGELLKVELAAGSESITEKTGINIPFTVDDSGFLGFFGDSELPLGFSIGSTVEVNGTSEPMVTSVRIAPVAERILVFYAVSLKRYDEDHSWTENAVTAWSNKVMAANPSVVEELPPPPIPTLSPLRIAAIAGLLIALVAWLALGKKRRSRQS